MKPIFLTLTLILATTFISSYASGDVTLDENRIAEGMYTGTIVAITYSASPVFEAVHFREDREGAKNWRITNQVRDELKNPYGEIERLAQLFQKAFDNNLVLTIKIDADGELETITLSKRQHEAQDDSESTRLENGANAPALEVESWSDGVDRRLEDLKGKTVVLHFWGTWCGPCIQTIPVWKQLEEKYREKNVVFLGIHTAGADIEDIRGFMKKHDWEHVTAIDKGESIPESGTFTTYGVPAVNQIVVIDPNGVVRYNGHKPTQTDGPVAIARELGVKGPVDKATAKEMLEGGIAIFIHMYGKEIEAALKPTEQK